MDNSTAQMSDRIWAYRKDRKDLRGSHRETACKHFYLRSTPAREHAEEMRNVADRVLLAWDYLQGNRRHSSKTIEKWLINQMAPALRELRNLLATIEAEEEQ